MTQDQAPSDHSLEPLPLRISYVLWGTEVCRLHLIPVGQEPHSLGRYWPSGLTKDAVAFITEHCRCAYCKAAVAASLAPCRCGKAQRRGYVLEVNYSQPTHSHLFREILERESSRAKGRTRRARIGSSGEKTVRMLYPEMLHAQEHRCYFCAGSLIDETGKAVFHADHYEPLHSGGSNGIENIVLACPSCNRRKGKLWPTTFNLRIARERGPDATVIVRRIRRQLSRWRTSKAAAIKTEAA